MAPRNRGKGKKGGKQKKKKNVAENEVEEKYRKAALEVDILKEHLALRRDVARQAKADSEGLKQRLLELEQELEMSRDDKKDIYEEMIRQYQELQRQTETRIQQLETETKQLQEQLGQPGPSPFQAGSRPGLLGEGSHSHAHGAQGETARVRAQSPGDLGPWFTLGQGAMKTPQHGQPLTPQQWQLGCFA
ncbi:coiled-coil domain-containing protein 153 isoform X3 [Mauremys reevesii]|uniref:coiled-coil domain-containing protein 153 isoform X3 n=1 Tax=Mauremys reevesii TaxID=260615 RepID=UPI00193EEDAD|nr:coiled-coil domain-containing protein 153 isoform X3 [Mauremys reevesii]